MPAVAGAIELRIQVHAPRWIEVARVIVLVDGHRAIERRVSGQAPTPFDESLRVPIARDAFVIVRVEGDRPMAPIVGDLHRFRVLPFAVTNPIWVDGDGDGASHPPP